MLQSVKAILPTRALGLFLLLGFADLAITAVLHAQGRVTELNPIMRPFIQRSELLFAFVKGTTLVAGWIALAWYARYNRDFVRKLSLVASGAYVTIWVVWFMATL